MPLTRVPVLTCPRVGPVPLPPIDDGWNTVTHVRRSPKYRSPTPSLLVHRPIGLDLPPASSTPHPRLSMLPIVLALDLHCLPPVWRLQLLLPLSLTVHNRKPTKLYRPWPPQVAVILQLSLSIWPCWSSVTIQAYLYNIDSSSSTPSIKISGSSRTTMNSAASDKASAPTPMSLTSASKALTLSFLSTTKTSLQNVAKKSHT